MKLRSGVRRIEVICRAQGVRLAEAAMQFPQHRPAVVLAVPGGRGIDGKNAESAAIRATEPSWLRVELESEGPMRPDAAMGSPSHGPD